MNPRQSRDSGILCPGPEFFFENSLSRCSLQKGFRARERPPSGSTLSCPVQTAAPAQRPTQDGCVHSQPATHSPVAGACWHPAQSFLWTSGHREVGGGAGESLEPSIRPRKGLGPPQELGHWDGRQGLLHQTGGMVWFGVQALQATFRKKRQVREAAM